jgi:hypothetical protein
MSSAHSADAAGNLAQPVGRTQRSGSGLRTKTELRANDREIEGPYPVRMG